MIRKIEIEDGFSVLVENDTERQETKLLVERGLLIFTSKQNVVDHIRLLNKALEFWEFD